MVFQLREKINLKVLKNMAVTKKVSKEDVMAQIPKLLDHLLKDWKAYSDRAGFRPEHKSNKIYTFEKGSSYVKIVTSDKDGSSRSVAGFVALKDGKFPAGTILKAAGWKAPATNFSRGDIFDSKTWNYRWTGIG